MSAIPCSSVSTKTMADGTLRISFDIEPIHALDAFALFRAPGTPAAIAALQVGYATVKDSLIDQKTTEVIDKADNIDKPKGGALAKLAGMWCSDPEFLLWSDCETSTQAKYFVLETCEIESRAELDHDPIAAEKFHRLIRGPYQKHLIARGIVS